MDPVGRQAEGARVGGGKERPGEREGDSPGLPGSLRLAWWTPETRVARIPPAALLSVPLLLSTLDPSFWPPRVHQASRRDPGLREGEARAWRGGEGTPRVPSGGHPGL